MENSKVVTNTSPLINLALINQLQLLEEQFDEVIVPEKVLDEVDEGKEGFESIKNALGEYLKLKESPEDPLFREFRRTIDSGESAAIRLGLEEDADLVLLDEREGRDAAKSHNLDVTGVLGILIKACNTSNTDIEKEVNKLERNGFWISEELKQKIIEKNR